MALLHYVHSLLKHAFYGHTEPEGQGQFSPVLWEGQWPSSAAAAAAKWNYSLTGVGLLYEAV